jgi:hypothetical protein
MSLMNGTWEWNFGSFNLDGAIFDIFKRLGSKNVIIPIIEISIESLRPRVNPE